MAALTCGGMGRAGRLDVWRRGLRSLAGFPGAWHMPIHLPFAFESFALYPIRRHVRRHPISGSHIHCHPQASEQWLAGMHTAAKERGLTIQYCMALPSDLVASMQFPHVTNYRASDDYAGSSVTNFNIQTSSLLGLAVGLRPSKDVFFSTSNAPANPYIRRLSPNHPTVPGVDLQLNALIATLSTGPVAIGDGPNATDRALVMRSCRADGLLLQADKPPTAIDAMYDGRPAPVGGFARAGGAQVWTTYSSIRPSRATADPNATLPTAFSSDPAAWSPSPASPMPSGLPTGSAVFRMLLSIDVAEPFAVDPAQDFYPGFDADGSGHVYLWEHEVARCSNGSAAVAGGCAMLVLPKLDDSHRPLDGFVRGAWFRRCGPVAAARAARAAICAWRHPPC